MCKRNLAGDGLPGDKTLPKAHGVASLREVDENESGGYPPTTETQDYSEVYAAAPGFPSLDALPPANRFDKQGSIFFRVMDSILVNCIRLNDALGGHGRQTTTNIEKVRGCVDQLAQLGYAEAIYAIKQELALVASKHIQVRYNETVYWEIIKKGAVLLDPATLPTAKGPVDEFTMAEKVATETFMKEADYGLSLANKRLCRILWKRLFEVRKAGVDRLLLYRTKEFDDFCRGYKSECGNSLVKNAQFWEKYSLHFERLENRQYHFTQLPPLGSQGI
ncbi:uncharacterized protein KD926_004825 [Aspergillus affinis]|uniref:uncharacterized protein n=1 Tax=Aspergillus affinis TaxID=1070780 RepID=UPI0022FE66A0|nr:uncharacterized protein KD926_004825 [Aspergillus affinis]KAI9035011.1 hypothetical protein KD926_004825 [Aspergillus affinis]